MKKKILIGILLIIILLLVFNTQVYAFTTNDVTGGTLRPSVKNKMDTVGKGIIQLIATAGSILSVIILIILGIKYMMGSVEEKASYKKSLFPYVIGAGILFAASTIAGIIYNIAINL